jgi:hypothetical protein
VTSPFFDGRPARDFRLMTSDERLDKLSREAALILELRRSRSTLEAAEPVRERLRTPNTPDTAAPGAPSF